MIHLTMATVVAKQHGHVMSHFKNRLTQQWKFWSHLSLLTKDYLCCVIMQQSNVLFKNCILNAHLEITYVEIHGIFKRNFRKNILNSKELSKMSNKCKDEFLITAMNGLKVDSLEERHV